MVNPPGPVLVIGAAGQQGGAVARELLDRGWAVKALVRDAGAPGARPRCSSGSTSAPLTPPISPHCEIHPGLMTLETWLLKTGWKPASPSGEPTHDSEGT